MMLWFYPFAVCYLLFLLNTDVILLFYVFFSAFLATIFFPGPRELTGAVDLITHYKLLPHHEFFCKKSLPVSIADTHYLHNVVGDTEIRKGEGMQLDQLIQNPSYTLDGNTRIRPFDLDALREAFNLRETTPVDLPSVSNFFSYPDDMAKCHSVSKHFQKTLFFMSL